jgi:hypothetical protein
VARQTGIHKALTVCLARHLGNHGCTTKEGYVNLLLILLIILVLVVLGLGFLVKWLFWVAGVLFLVWLITLLIDRLRRRR